MGGGQVVPNPPPNGEGGWRGGYDGREFFQGGTRKHCALQMRRAGPRWRSEPGAKFLIFRLRGSSASDSFEWAGRNPSCALKIGTKIRLFSDSPPESRKVGGGKRPKDDVCRTGQGWEQGWAQSMGWKAGVRGWKRSVQPALWAMKRIISCNWLLCSSATRKRSLSRARFRMSSLASAFRRL